MRRSHASMKGTQRPSSASSLTSVDAFEITLFSSAFAFAYLVYALEPFEPPDVQRIL
ncbi:hypothetical protein BDM02DRAFT_3114267 [Thelephora ganbajun]|uniref:Uncharacterized protein n=1 Tax=Thelephora ganbajun TaxID=370292 RepID=A0ACB6ZHK8_THEGA|nr:hypothetical protein BDM02DRAFT_3114267 [Thelephora ganbajun]